ncbi:hypothetical protein [Segetibacter koreensis]|uniref:hypothetical protein n=1 Tax=Segetibacter koreensis TaxID=398037 RepID=UPI00036E2D7F|nr:hypothetical protein [Segetibacter koreensis]
MIKVTLRAKAITGDRKSLYLDIYPAIFNPKTGKKSRREFLNLYIYDQPRTLEQKRHNKKAWLQASEILINRQQLLEKGEYTDAVSNSVDLAKEKNKNEEILIQLLQQVRNMEQQLLDKLNL